TDVDDPSLRSIGGEVHPPGRIRWNHGQVRNGHCAGDVKNSLDLCRDVFDGDNVHCAWLGTNREQPTILVIGKISYLFSGRPRLHRLRSDTTGRGRSRSGYGKGLRGKRRTFSDPGKVTALD